MCRRSKQRHRLSRVGNSSASREPERPCWGLAPPAPIAAFEFTIAMVRDPEDMLIGAGAVIRDVTAQWSTDKALKGWLAALESRRHKQRLPSENSTMRLLTETLI